MTTSKLMTEDDLTQLTLEDTLSDGELFPGFTRKVADIFEIGAD